MNCYHSYNIYHRLIPGVASTRNRTGDALTPHKEEMSGISDYMSFDDHYSIFLSLCWRCCPILAHPACDLTGREKARCLDALFITEPDSKHLLLSEEFYSR